MATVPQITQAVEVAKPVWTTRDAHNGNRWWVAYNTDQTVTGVGKTNPNINEPSGYEAVGSGDAVDDAIFAAAAKVTAASAAAGKTYTSGKGPTVHVQNISWANVHGPYTSYAAAEAALVALQAKSPAAGAAAQATGTTGITQALANLLGFVTSEQGWIRISKIALGSVLVIVGVVKMTGSNSVVATVAKATPGLGTALAVAGAAKKTATGKTGAVTAKHHVAQVKNAGKKAHAARKAT